MQFVKYCVLEVKEYFRFQTILKCMHSTGKEIKSLQDMAKKADSDKKSEKGVTFKESDALIAINEFFSCFSLEFDLSKSKAATSAGAEAKVKLNFKSEHISTLGKNKYLYSKLIRSSLFIKLTQFLVCFLGTLFFCGCLNNDSSVEEWKQKVQNADLLPAELLALCLKFWCQNALVSSSYVNMMEKMYRVVKSLSDLEGNFCCC